MNLYFRPFVPPSKFQGVINSDNRLWGQENVKNMLAIVFVNLLAAVKKYIFSRANFCMYILMKRDR